jgi:2-methylcitrate dehydratase PrpD
MAEPAGGIDTQQRAAAWLADAVSLDCPPHVLMAARLTLADWLGVAIGGASEAAARIAHAHVAALTSGSAPCTLLLGGTASPTDAALANGTAAHCLDFDDTHVGSVTHLSAPLWAAVLASGEALSSAGRPRGAHDLLRSYLAGFQVAARIGAGIGEAITARGWHSTGVFGRIASAAAGSVLARLDAAQCSHALALAATQAAGLTASFGTMAKPFHAGKAASDGVLAALLAARGFEGGSGLFGRGGALERALIQDGNAIGAGASAAGVPDVADVDFGGDWEVLHNSIKPYAACHLTHPAIDAARALGSQVRVDEIESVTCRAGALATQVTGSRGRLPRTALEAKFDLPWCIALALAGRTVSAGDFREPWAAEPILAALASRVSVDTDPGHGFASASLALRTCAGHTLEYAVDTALGHPGNPIGWDGMREKFTSLVEPVLGEATPRLFDAVRSFGDGAGWPDITALIRMHRS